MQVNSEKVYEFNSVINQVPTAVNEYESVFHKESTDFVNTWLCSNPNTQQDSESITQDYDNLTNYFLNDFERNIPEQQGLKNFADAFGKPAFGSTVDIVKESYSNWNIESCGSKSPSYSEQNLNEKYASTIANWERTDDDFTFFPNYSSEYLRYWYQDQNLPINLPLQESTLPAKKNDDDQLHEGYGYSISDNFKEYQTNLNYQEELTVIKNEFENDEAETRLENLHTPPPLSCEENPEKANELSDQHLFFPKSKAIEIPPTLSPLKLGRRLPPITKDLNNPLMTTNIPEGSEPKNPENNLNSLPIGQPRPFVYPNYQIYPFYPMYPMFNNTIWPIPAFKTIFPKNVEQPPKKYVTVRELIEERKYRKCVIQSEDGTNCKQFQKKEKISNPSQKMPDVMKNWSTLQNKTATQNSSYTVEENASSLPHTQTEDVGDPNSATTLLCLLPARNMSNEAINNINGVPLVITDFQNGKVNAREHKPKHFEMKTLVIGSFKVDAVPQDSGRFRNKFKIVFSKRLFIYEFELVPSKVKPTMICVQVSFHSLVAMRCVGRLIQIRVKKQPIMYEGTMQARAGIVTQTPVYDKQKPIDLTEGQLAIRPVHRILLKRSQSTRLKDVLIRFDPWFHALFATPIGDEKCTQQLQPNAHAEWKNTCRLLKNKEQEVAEKTPGVKVTRVKSIFKKCI